MNSRGAAEPIVQADLAAIKQLAAQLNGSASTVRGIDFDALFAAVCSGPPGSDIAAACSISGAQIEGAPTPVATRIDDLATANIEVAGTLGATDADHATAIAQTPEQ